MSELIPQLQDLAQTLIEKIGVDGWLMIGMVVFLAMLEFAVRGQFKSRRQPASTPPREEALETAAATAEATSMGRAVVRASPAPQRRGRFASDSEFLPAALEIVETPPSPVATALMLGICAFFTAALAWSYFGKLDVHALAPGKIQVSGRTKIVQPLEAGRVVAIHVENGAQVKEGDVLVELDPTDTTADHDALARELESTRAEVTRRSAAVAAAQSAGLVTQTIRFAEGTSEAVSKRETAAMLADLSQLRSTLEALRAQIEEKAALKQRLALSIQARQRLLELAKERIGMREEIITRGAGSRALVIESELQYENFATQDAGDRGQQVEAEAAAKSLERKMVQTVDQFVAEQIQKGVEADRKREKLEEDIVKARSKRDRTRLRSPIAGTIQQLEVTTLGQVIASGQAILSVVPTDAPLEVEALISNKDIGFVTAGQRAAIKVDAFPFTRYGTIEADVLKVSTDAVEDRNATAMTDAISASRSQSGSPTRTSQGQNLVFPAVLRLKQRTISIDGRNVPLTAGMSVTAEVKTGERRAISFLLSPLGEVIRGAGGER
ncbi:MAG: HlyD family type I secretion periplasmic adaptor subunit [Proteobacteria bacterium]|nr:HlyD family type I secretion periplasmic adaptor subunit [Pseudomonadota bacterium]